MPKKIALIHMEHVWLDINERREREFGYRSLEIFSSFCRSGAFGGKENVSLENKLPLITSLERSENHSLMKNKNILTILCNFPLRDPYIKRQWSFQLSFLFPSTI